MTGSQRAKDNRVLLALWWGAHLLVLVPKRRGAGYLAQPYGHHQNPALDAVGAAVGCDVIGLDGYLDFTYPSETIDDPLGREAFASTICRRLEHHYGCPSRRVDAPEFWGHLSPGVVPKEPINTNKGE